MARTDNIGAAPWRGLPPQVAEQLGQVVLVRQALPKLTALGPDHVDLGGGETLPLPSAGQFASLKIGLGDKVRIGATANYVPATDEEGSEPAIEIHGTPEFPIHNLREVGTPEDPDYHLVEEDGPWRIHPVLEQNGTGATTNLYGFGRVGPVLIEEDVWRSEDKPGATNHKTTVEFDENAFEVLTVDRTLERTATDPLPDLEIDLPHLGPAEAAEDMTGKWFSWNSARYNRVELSTGHIEWNGGQRISFGMATFSSSAPDESEPYTELIVGDRHILSPIAHEGGVQENWVMSGGLRYAMKTRYSDEIPAPSTPAAPSAPVYAAPEEVSPPAALPQAATSTITIRTMQRADQPDFMPPFTTKRADGSTSTIYVSMPDSTRTE